MYPDQIHITVSEPSNSSITHLAYLVHVLLHPSRLLRHNRL
jgi:hypothetical protein